MHKKLQIIPSSPDLTSINTREPKRTKRNNNTSRNSATFEVTLFFLSNFSLIMLLSLSISNVTPLMHRHPDDVST